MVSVIESLKRVVAGAVANDRDTYDLAADASLSRSRINNGNLAEAREYRRRAVRRQDWLERHHLDTHTKPRFAFREEPIRRSSFLPR